MEYGCIGEKLTHSFSKEIHNSFAEYEYELCEIPRGELDRFAKNADFKAINVTIPYKELIMPYLDEIDSAAKSTGAVNTVVNRDGALCGYNTDFYGMKSLISREGIDVSGKKVAILGTGGTSKTALAVANYLGAKKIIRVSRDGNEDAVKYEDLYKKHADAEVIINTTPSGMYPKIFDTPVDLSKFHSLTGVIDAIYNPLRSRLILSAHKRGIKAAGGLYMLVAQAVRASEIFLDRQYGEDTLEKVYRKILSDKENIVLIGMPSSGKSTVGQILAKTMNRELYDTDTVIEEHEGCSISDIFKNKGEAYFREVEANVIRDMSSKNGVIISTGGGVPLREENVDSLKMNGKLYFIDRPLENLIPTDSRPLTSTREAVEKKFRERYGIYIGAMDRRIDANCAAEEVANKIERDFTL